ncbi:hypothetical protein [Streptacidiphilus sp. P02-A3a]|uniref:hypothetical protein n=1 Tax=Streptacidiphilus sp. P02-A3a TaxID=2704468 RepID=UPI0015FA0C90|nr:hypothetical protein [Streptacidiphilus sp. P02-A3a]QMU72127.1 hypothetical protein GXP74_31705 [Streptacidiphilus sp. P02-A3a]
MATAKKAAPAAKRQTAEEKVKAAYAAIANVEQANAGGDAEAAATWAAEAARLIKTIPVAQREAVTLALGEVQAAAPAVAEDAAPAGDAEADATESSELVTVADTTDYAAVAGMPELIEAGAAKIAEGAKQFAAGNTLAREIASILVDARVHLIHNGAPDLKAVGNPAKMTSRAMFISALEQSEDRSEDTRTAYEKLQKAVQNVIPDVLVDYVRALDHSPEEVEEHFAAAVAAHPDLTPSEAVFTYHDLPRKGRAELMREARAAKKLIALEEAAAEAERKALAGTFEDKKEGAAVVAALAAVEGERVSFDPEAEDDQDDQGGADDSGDAGDDGDDKGESTPRAFNNLEKITELIEKLTGNAPKVKGDVQRKALRADMQKAADALAALRLTI